MCEKTLLIYKTLTNQSQQSMSDKPILLQNTEFVIRKASKNKITLKCPWTHLKSVQWKPLICFFNRTTAFRVGFHYDTELLYREW